MKIFGLLQEFCAVPVYQAARRHNPEASTLIQRIRCFKNYFGFEVRPEVLMMDITRSNLMQMSLSCEADSY